MKKIVALGVGAIFWLLCSTLTFADRSLQEVVNSTEENGVLTLSNHTYEGNLVIDKPITIVGSGQTVIRGDGTGNVITITSPKVHLENLTIEHGGQSMSSQEEYSGIKVKADHVLLKNLKIMDTYHGVYLKNANNNEVNHVAVTGRGHGIVASQGNGIQLIHASGNRLIGNVIEGTRDGIAFDYSDHNIAEDNSISHTRYGLHYMYSNENKFQKNHFTHNNGGAAIMVSKGLELSNNEFTFHDGSQAFGILLKSAEDVKITDNYFFQNLRGIYIDDSVRGYISQNHFFHNQIGIELWGSATNQLFTGNHFANNTLPFITVGSERDNKWNENGKGNDWGEEFPMLDANQDEIGDYPIEYKSSLYKLIQDNELVYLFLNSPAISVYEKINQFLNQQETMFVDDYPLVTKENPSLWTWLGALFIVSVLGVIYRRRKPRQ